MLQSVLFPHLDRKDIEVCFDEQASSSDGGSVLLKACDHALGLTETLAASLEDPRQPSKITHTFPELLRQRVFGLALGYADCHDRPRGAGVQRVPGEPCGAEAGGGALDGAGAVGV